MEHITLSQPHSGMWRVPFLRRCRLKGARVDGVGIVCNLSVRGAYVAIESPPPVGTAVRVAFQLPWMEDPLEFDAVVCWKNSDGRARGLPPGCGVEFLAPTWESRARLEALVHDFHHSDPELLERQ